MSNTKVNHIVMYLFIKLKNNVFKIIMYKCKKDSIREIQFCILDCAAVSNVRKLKHSADLYNLTVYSSLKQQF